MNNPPYIKGAGIQERAHIHTGRKPTQVEWKPVHEGRKRTQVGNESIKMERGDVHRVRTPVKQIRTDAPYHSGNEIHNIVGFKLHNPHTQTH